MNKIEAALILKFFDYRDAGREMGVGGGGAIPQFGGLVHLITTRGQIMKHITTGSHRFLALPPILLVLQMFKIRV